MKNLNKMATVFLLIYTACINIDAMNIQQEPPEKSTTVTDLHQGIANCVKQSEKKNIRLPGVFYGVIASKYEQAITAYKWSEETDFFTPSSLVYLTAPTNNQKEVLVDGFLKNSKSLKEWTADKIFTNVFVLGCKWIEVGGINPGVRYLSINELASYKINSFKEVGSSYIIEFRQPMESVENTPLGEYVFLICFSSKEKKLLNTFFDILQNVYGNLPVDIIKQIKT